MEQLAFYTNCPYCGQLIEIVSPFLDARKPTALFAIRVEDAIDKSYHTKIFGACSACKKSVKFYWQV